MNSDKLFESMKELWQSFEENHTSFKEKGNKAAGGRARKAIGDIKKFSN